jgi:stearoyl-CoA desaturase (delta-9 desaturase)
MSSSLSNHQDNQQEKPPIAWLPATVLTLTFIVAITVVPWYGFTEGYSWPVLLAGLLFWGANGMSISAGYLRLWSHNAYKAHWILRLPLALFGAAATQNSILVWASGHRRHHRFVDDNERDPYSANRGFWFSHMGWMLRSYPSGALDFSNAKDLQRDPIVVWQHKYYIPITLTMNFLPPILVGLATGEMVASLLIVGVLRLVLSHHTTFFINSLAHIWGKQPYTDSNTARDNTFLALLTYGEGYHNFHHIFQSDYRNGVRWWQFDPTKWLIRGCALLGITWDLNRIPDMKIQKARLMMQFKKAEHALANAGNAEDWRVALEREYDQFTNAINEWTELRAQWVSQKREQFTEARQELTQEFYRKWESTTIHNRLQEIEYAMKMQSKRLESLTLQFAGQAA